MNAHAPKAKHRRPWFGLLVFIVIILLVVAFGLFKRKGARKPPPPPAQSRLPIEVDSTWAACVPGWEKGTPPGRA
jgi:hypothetical protein